MWKEEELAGNTIIGVKVKSPFLWLEVEGGGWIEIQVSGDCCSEAFIDSVCISGKPKLTGAIDEIQLPSFPTVQDFDYVTAVCLKGEGGHVSFMHRNSSNGYYGNYISMHSRGVPAKDAENGREWYRTVQA